MIRRSDRVRPGRVALLLALTIALPDPASRAIASETEQLPKPPLSITFFGVSTLLLSAGEDQILIDGFFTRPKLKRTIFGRLDPDDKLIEERLNDAGVVRLRAVLVAHAHHDHALDAASIAALTETAKGGRLKSDAVVVGDASVARLVRANGVSSARSTITQEGSEFIFGPFRVKAYKVDHGPAWPPLHWLLTGDMPARQTLPAWFGTMKDEENYSYLITYGDRRILVHPSAGRRAKVDGRAPPLPQAELVFLGVGGLGVKNQADYARDYWIRAQFETGAQTFVPIHWDRFTEPLEAGLSDIPPPLDKPKRTFEILQANRRPGVQACFLPPRTPLTLPAEGSATSVVAQGNPDLTHRPACEISSTPNRSSP